MRINQSGVLPTQPSNSRIRENSPPNAPALSARTLTLLVNRFFSSPLPPLSTLIHSLEDRGACHLSPAGKKVRVIARTQLG